jgi:hypothetical protein
LDAGSDRISDAAVDVPDEGNDLPVDATSPVIINNDGPSDNWQGEYAILLSSVGLELVGFIVNDSPAWPNLDANLRGWQAMVEAARLSGFESLPDPLLSAGGPLQRPATGEIDDTEPNRSQGAQAIVGAAGSIAENAPPLVVITGGRLTDVADAYLVDPGIAERIVVVSSLGDLAADGALMGNPNGEMDPWANTIVVQRLRYVQVSAFYEQLDDLPSSRLPELPKGAFGDWIAAKQPNILDLSVASDQVSVLAVALPGFAQQVERAVQNGTAPLGLGATPRLSITPDGPLWLVTSVDGVLARERFWELLLR